MKLLVVVGATGHQGSAVIQYFLTHHSRNGYKLRGITRNVNSSVAREFQSAGVEMVEADLGDLPALTNAFHGATHIFANTDSNQLIFSALQDTSLLRNGQNAAQYGVEKEQQFGENIADAAAATSTLERIVWSSLPSPKKRSGGKFSNVLMFDMKDTIAAMFEGREGLKDKLSILMNGFYLDNPLKVPDLYAPRLSSDGTFELSLPMDGDVPIPLSDISADEGKWVKALFDAPAGVTLLGVTEMMSWRQWLTVWGDHLKVKVRFVRADPESFAQFVPGIQRAISEEFQYVGEYGFVGDDVNIVTLDTASMPQGFCRTFTDSDSWINLYRRLCRLWRSTLAERIGHHSFVRETHD